VEDASCAKWVLNDWTEYTHESPAIIAMIPATREIFVPL